LDHLPPGACGTAHLHNLHFLAPSNLVGGDWSPGAEHCRAGSSAPVPLNADINLGCGLGRLDRSAYNPASQNFLAVN